MTEKRQTLPNVKIREGKKLYQIVFTNVLWAMDTSLVNVHMYIRLPEPREDAHTHAHDAI